MHKEQVYYFLYKMFKNLQVLNSWHKPHALELKKAHMWGWQRTLSNYNELMNWPIWGTGFFEQFMTV